MIVAGIDPGVSGALAIVDELGHCHTSDMPLDEDGYVDGHLVANFLVFGNVDFAVIEHSQSMPKQGVKSTFTYGQAFGQVLGVVQCLNPYVLIKPQMWKRQIGLTGKGTTRTQKKGAARTLAIKLFPKSAEQFKLAKDHNRAEAALLAWWWLHHPLRNADEKSWKVAA